MTSVILGSARTPVGKLLGVLAPLSAVELGATAISGALERAAVSHDEIDTVYLGNVVQAGVGPNPARLAAAAASIPLSAPATSINKLCLSGLTAIGHAHLAIGGGLSRLAIGGGTESMTNAPHLLAARTGVKYGDTTIRDALERDALVCGLDSEVMGAATQRYQADFDITREEQDTFAAASHQRAAAARDAGSLADEIVPVAVHRRSGVVEVVDDEGIRADTTIESLSSLRPAFASDGTITAGTSSQLSDGAAAVVIADAAEAEHRGITPLAEILAYATVAGPDPSLLLQPARAISAVLERAGLSLSEVDLFEINEAFASVVVASTRELGVPHDIVNVNGGAIAIGHPVGMSGARLVLSLASELRRRGGGVGVAALCGGGGQGDAILIRVP